MTPESRRRRKRSCSLAPGQPLRATPVLSVSPVVKRLPERLTQKPRPASLLLRPRRGGGADFPQNLTPTTGLHQWFVRRGAMD